MFYEDRVNGFRTREGSMLYRCVKDNVFRVRERERDNVWRTVDKGNALKMTNMVSEEDGNMSAM